MINNYFQILGIIDKLNEWNEQLNGFAAEHMDNVWVGTAILLVIIVVSVWGINTLNKWKAKKAFFVEKKFKNMYNKKRRGIY